MWGVSREPILLMVVLVLLLLQPLGYHFVSMGSGVAQLPHRDRHGRHFAS